MTSKLVLGLAASALILGACGGGTDAERTTVTSTVEEGWELEWEEAFAGATAETWTEICDVYQTSQKSTVIQAQTTKDDEPMTSDQAEQFYAWVIEKCETRGGDTEAVQSSGPVPRTDPGSNTGCSSCDYLIDNAGEDSAFCVQYGMTETGSFPVEEAAKQLGLTVSEYEMTMEAICD